MQVYLSNLDTSLRRTLLIVLSLPKNRKSWKNRKKRDFHFILLLSINKESFLFFIIRTCKSKGVYYNINSLLRL